MGRQSSGKADAALSDFARAHALDPDDPGIANAYGAALIRAGRSDQAVEVLRAEAAARPQIAVTWFSLASALTGLGRMDEARQALETAVDLKPDFADALGKLAMLAMHRGDAAEAERLAKQTLALNPDDADARRARIEALLASRRAVEAEAAAKNWLTRVAGRDRVATMQAAGLLGDALDAQKRPAEAFAAYVQSKAAFAAANEATFGALNTAPLAETLRRMRQDFAQIPTTGWRSVALANAESEPVRHIFLMGFMRSGTTLLEQALSLHPDVVTLEEQEPLAEAGAAFLGRPGGMAQIAALDGEALAKARATYFAAVRQMGVEPGGRVLVDKLPFNGIKLPLIARLFPDAKVLFALRDPRDVVFSCFQRRLRPNSFAYEMRTLAGTARFYAAYMELVRAYRATLDLAVLDHRHEALVEDFEDSVRAVCAFAGLDFRPDMVRFQNRADAGQVASQTSSQLREGLSTRGLGRWRAYAAELAPVIPTLQPWIDAYGYAEPLGAAVRPA